MSAEEFRSKLKQLGYPKADSLDITSLEWMFEDSSLARFLQWFIHETDERNYLTTEEVKRWEELKTSGVQILELEELKAANISTEKNSVKQLEAEVDALEEELRTATAQLKMANIVHERISEQCVDLQEKTRRRKLSHAKVADELTESMKRRHEFVVTMDATFSEVEQTLTQVQETLDKAANKGQTGDARNSSVAETTRNVHSSCDYGAASRKFFSFSPLDKLQLDFQESNKMFEEYLSKVFPEKVSEMAGVGTEAQYQMLDLTNVPDSFAQMSVEQRWFYVLLNQFRESSIKIQESWARAMCREQVLCKEIEVLERCLESAERGNLPNWSTVDAEIEANTIEAAKLQRRAPSTTWEEIQQLIREVAEMHFNVSVTGNYGQKLERQNRVIAQLDEAIEFVSHSQAIVQFLSWMLTHESNLFERFQKTLSEMEEALREDADDARSRITAMEKLAKIMEEEKKKQDSGSDVLTSLRAVLSGGERARDEPVDVSSNTEATLATIRCLRELSETERKSVDADLDLEMQQLCQLESSWKELQESIWEDCSTKHGLPLQNPKLVGKALKRLEESLVRMKETFLCTKQKYDEKVEILRNNPRLRTQRQLYLEFYKRLT